MITTDDATTIATVATWVARGTGVALTVAIAGAMVEAMWPGMQNAVGARVWAGLVSALSVALRVFMLVTGVRAVRALAVTYLHTYRADKGTGRHYAGLGRLWQASGRHRAQVWA